MDMVLRVFVLGVFAVIGAYIACRGAYSKGIAEVLIGSDILAACMASMTHCAFGMSLEGCLILFIIIFVAFSIFVHKLLRPRDSVAKSCESPSCVQASGK